MNLISAGVFRAAIKDAGMSQQQIANAAGCNRTFISQLVNGRRKAVRQETAANIAAALGVPTRYLFKPDNAAAPVTPRRAIRRENVAS